MAPFSPNSQLENDEGHSGEQSFREKREEHDKYSPRNEVKTPAIATSSMYDDGVNTFTGVAQEAQVIRAPPIVQTYKAEVPRYIAPSNNQEEDNKVLVLGRPGNVPSSTGAMNIPTYKTTPVCYSTKAYLNEEDMDFRQHFAQMMMMKQALNHNGRPVSDSPESIEPARAGKLINESPNSSINGINQTVGVADNPIARENCVRTSGNKSYEIRDSTRGGKGMFATKDILDGDVIVEEDSLVRLLCFDPHTRANEDDPYYQEMIQALNHQLEYLVDEEDRQLIESLKPFDGEEPFILRVLRKYGLETYHPDYFHCTALYRDICRVNHSCDGSNAILGTQNRQNDWTTGKLAARRDIKKGEEILIDYTSLGGKLRARMEVFQKYRFICGWSTCRSCSWYYQYGNRRGTRCEFYD